MPDLLSPVCQTYRLGSVELIPLGEGRVFQLPDREIAIFRTRSGRVYASEPRCPHRAGPLADGLIGDRILICPLHACRFELATGQPVGHDCPPVRTYPVTVTAAGDIAVEVSE